MSSPLPRDAKAARPAARAPLPAVTLPKGGGAIRGIGEKFSTNAVTGTASFSVPIFVSPGREGFDPDLSLSYDSGAGNGPFGFGWTLSLPAITRKTDKRLPRYRDADESDVFLLAGAEDLVPILADGRPAMATRTIGTTDYTVTQYRPRIEGLFARIERWTDGAGDSHWRVIARDNVTTIYGASRDSRLADPADPRRVFSWLMAERYDDKGNAICYVYAAENSRGLERQTPLPHEANRTVDSRTAQRYLKRVFYGNRTPRQSGERLRDRTDWLFEVVFDYGDGHYDELDAAPIADDRHRFVRAGRAGRTIGDEPDWPARPDPFSTYRAGFDIRTYRRCARVLMFHYFDELARGVPYLVRSTEFRYREQGYSFLDAITQSGFVEASPANITGTGLNGYRRYLKRSLPALELDYSEATIDKTIHDLDAVSLRQLPIGLDGARYQWLDLDGDGVPGLLTEQSGAWYYTPNLSPLNETRTATLGGARLVSPAPALSMAAGGQFMDLAGDGQPDFVNFSGELPGFYERDGEGWAPFRAFTSFPEIDPKGANARFLDLDGDGHADILITEDEALCWYPSLGERGFGAVERRPKPLDEERGPRLVFADGTQSIYLSDFSGDGLTDLVRVRNGEVCYWPNLGHGRFGAKITMDNPPWFDAPDLFDQRRVQLTDIDGSGPTDIIYFGEHGVSLYFNQSGNGWSDAARLTAFPPVDNLSSMTAIDLLGNGTACLVWSSPLPQAAGRQMRYVDLMSGHKPHLLIGIRNNLGAETRITYASSSKFYLQDRRDGTPWVTRLPFPVHVVERVETFDLISRNRFSTRYAYHHGYFDGEEREFRGFGLVDQWDTDELGALTGGTPLPASNIDPASYVRPALTRRWFHTGAYVDGTRISRQFAHEYYRESGLDAASVARMDLADTVVDGNLPADHAREAIRALKGQLLREESYARDGSAAAQRPYVVIESNYSIQLLQPRGPNAHAVFLTHPQETVSFHYERASYSANGTALQDPRVSHDVVLDVDRFGNVLQSAAIGYGRRFESDDPTLTADDHDQQRDIKITYTVSGFTVPVSTPDAHCTPMPATTNTFEVLKLVPRAAIPGITNFFSPDELRAGLAGAPELPYEDTDGTGATQNRPYLRPIERNLTVYRSNDLTRLLDVGELESMALPGESYSQALTPGLIAATFVRDGQPLIDDSDAAFVEGGYVRRGTGASRAYWLPSGRVFYSPGRTDSPAVERAFAERHFFLPHRSRDPFWRANFDTQATLRYDAYDLLVLETEDALGNRVTAGERDDTRASDDPGRITPCIDYRHLQPLLLTDANGNRSQAVCDALGLVVATVQMGKIGEDVGDEPAQMPADLTPQAIQQFFAGPKAGAPSLLNTFTSRLVYDLDAFARTRTSHPDDPRAWQPAWSATISRESHVRPAGGPPALLQVSFAYSDGFGREIQKKLPAEQGPVPVRDARGTIVVDGDGLPTFTTASVAPRWVGTGWVVFNNKAKPVQQYEPFFTDTHAFEFDVRIGVTTTFLYDPLDRVIATLHPDGTYTKVRFDPWREMAYDVNDTVLLDPATDPDVAPLAADFLAALAADGRPWQTWYALRSAGGLGANEQSAAAKAREHADTPSVVHLDTLGRTFLSTVINRRSGIDERFDTRVRFDIEGNEREITDARGRVVMAYDYDMLGHCIRQVSMDAGARWMLNDVLGGAVRAWDSRGHRFTTHYDRLRRVTDQFVEGFDTAPNSSDPRTVGGRVLFEKLIYGEGLAGANLRTRVYQAFDPAGVITNEAYDFKGNALRVSRTLRLDYKGLPDWQTAVADGDKHTTSTAYDALNRPIEVTTADRTITRHRYNGANLLEAIDANLHGATDPVTNAPVWTPLLVNVDYDANGQRASVEYGNRVLSTYTYDRRTYRLRSLKTRRLDPAFAADCPQPRSTIWPGCGLQSLAYTYDPAGNVTHLTDDAQQRICFQNQWIDPSAEYTYDALYRLIRATGRELLGLSAANVRLAPSPMSCRSLPRWGAADPRDGRALGRYVQDFDYDEIGNLLSLRHRTTDSAHAGWRRCYQYEGTTNRLRSATDPGRPHDPALPCPTGHGGPPAYPERFTHNAHGSMLAMPHLPEVEWDYDERLMRSRRQAVNADDDEGVARQGERTYYVYDANNQRVRKVTEAANGAIKDERVYLGAFEVYRRGGSDPIVRQTLHVTDDTRRIALIETKTEQNGAAISNPVPVMRFQLANHLGSSTFELDANAEPITYEEYFPFGSTSYQATFRHADSPKRYRYAMKERDEESGLYYYGARYYAPWLGRWIGSEPEWSLHDDSSYAYAEGSPITKSDPDGRATKRGQLGAAKMYAIDEDRAVQGRYKGSPTDPANKRFTPQQDNASKGARTTPKGASGPAEVISLKQMKKDNNLAKGAQHMLKHNFDKTTEMKKITNRAGDKAMAWAKKKGLDTSDVKVRRQIADKTNARIRAEIRAGKSGEAKLVRAALKTANVDNRLRIKMDTKNAAKSPLTHGDVRKAHPLKQHVATGTGGKSGFKSGGHGGGGAPSFAKSVTPGKPVNSKGSGVLGKAMAAKGAYDSLQQGDYAGAITSVAALNPAVATALTLEKAHEEYAKGNTLGAALEVASLNPVVGAAKTGWEIGRALDEEYQVGDTAMHFWAQKLGYDID